MVDGSWRRIRCVVEVPVRGTYTEKDLRWAVERLLENGGANLRFRAAQTRTQNVGRAEVKEYDKVIVAQRRAARDAKVFQDARRLLQELGLDITRMETMFLKEEKK